jgi:predicted O-linked N-acetylglucosamine transferase (SPINDLY family)
LARDCARLGTLRHGLRDRLQSSPLCDGPAFARAMEAVYDDMWRRSRNGGGGAAT